MKPIDYGYTIQFKHLDEWINIDVGFDLPTARWKMGSKIWEARMQGMDLMQFRIVDEEGDVVE